MVARYFSSVPLVPFVLPSWLQIGPTSSVPLLSLPIPTSPPPVFFLPFSTGLDAYLSTWHATGCPIKDLSTGHLGLLGDWQGWPLARVFSDMYAYCILNKNGAASEGQSLLCCGSTSCAPTECTYPSALTLVTSALTHPPGSLQWRETHRKGRTKVMKHFAGAPCVTSGRSPSSR